MKHLAGVLERAAKLNIPTQVFFRESFYKTDEIVNLLVKNNIDLVVLAGFMWLVPKNILAAFPKGVVNIHPALLPKYGGKGMYGNHVHDAVISAGELTSGITIHFVNEIYDDGLVIFQKELEVDITDTPDSLTSKIHQLEYEYYPKVIEDLLK